MDIKYTGTLPDVSSTPDFSELLKEAADITYMSVMETLRSGGRPSSWVAKKDGSRSFLYKTGALYSAIRKESDAVSFAVKISRADIPYALAHQFGYGPLPKRPYMVFQDEDKKQIQELFADRLVKFFQTKRRPIGTQS